MNNQLSPTLQNYKDDVEFLFLGCILIVTRGYCTESNMALATYAEVKDLTNHPEVLLIDVRNPNEIEETGLIPTSINIPLSQVKAALSDETSAEQFKESYGRSKPGKGDPIIVSCRSGRRSAQAFDIVADLGYTNAKNYVGSWLEWADKEGLPRGN